MGYEWNTQEIYIAFLEAATVLSGLVLGFMELNDKHLQYSKFNLSKSSSPQIPSKLGMFLLYFPAFGVAALFVLCKVDWQSASHVFSRIGLLDFATNFLKLNVSLPLASLIVAAAVSLHFFKRVFEVMFIHRYSGTMGIGTMFLISNLYTCCAAHYVYTLQLPEQNLHFSLTTELFNLGCFVFLVGMMGNFYHHYILSTLRKPGVKEYFIPQGGLFEFVVCPHYLFEVTQFVGLALMAQTVFGFCIVAFVFFYLLGRSLSTKAWYLKKFESFPVQRKAMIPFLVTHKLIVLLNPF